MSSKAAQEYVREYFDRSRRDAGYILPMPKLTNYPGHGVLWDVGGRLISGGEAVAATTVATYLSEIVYEFNVARREKIRLGNEEGG
jgi:hypothetical protein